MSRSRPARVRAVLFDAVGTLFQSRGSIGETYSEVASRHGVEASPTFLDQRFETFTMLRGLPVEKEGWRDLIAAVFHEESRFHDFEAFFEDVYDVFRTGSRWRLFPETQAVLGRLRRAGFRLGVVTNFDARVVGVLDELGIASYFDTVQTAGATGCQKPDPGIFLLAAQALASEPEATLVVGDDPVQDLGGAHRAGMPALLIDRRPVPGNARFVISDLAAILGYLALPGLESPERRGEDD